MILDAITILFLFISFLLLLLTSVSLPIVKSIWLMKVNVAVGDSLLGVNSHLTFGVWGLCINGGSSFLGHGSSTKKECTKPKLGYSTKFTGDSKLTNLITKGVSTGLVLHPIATGVTFLALVLTIATIIRARTSKSRTLLVVTLITVGHASATALMAFIFDIVVDVKARKEAHKSKGVLKVSFGNAVWMTLVAAILLWIANSLLTVRLFKSRRRRTDAEKY